MRSTQAWKKVTELGDILRSDGTLILGNRQKHLVGKIQGAEVTLMI